MSGAEQTLARVRAAVAGWRAEYPNGGDLLAAIEDALEANLHNAGLGVGHIWTAVDCPAYRSLDGADCTCGGDDR